MGHVDRQGFTTMADVARTVGRCVAAVRSVRGPTHTGTRTTTSPTGRWERPTRRRAPTYQPAIENAHTTRSRLPEAADRVWRVGALVRV